MEKKYESDLTNGEKWEQSLKTIKNLKGRKRLEYLWAYYKIVPLILLAVILLVYLGGSIINRALDNKVLSVVVVDAARADDESAAQLEEYVLQALGADGKRDYVETVLTATSTESEENIAKLRVSLSIVSGADVVICGQKVYEEYAAQGAFADPEQFLGNSYEEFKPYMTDGQIDLEKCENSFLRKYVEYSPAYVCILEHSEHRESAVAILKEIVYNQQ